MCLISWERKQKKDPHKLFRGNFGVKKGGPNWAILGHKKFSLYFLSCPYFTKENLKIDQGFSFPAERLKPWEN